MVIAIIIKVGRLLSTLYDKAKGGSFKTQITQQPQWKKIIIKAGRLLSIKQSRGTAEAGAALEQFCRQCHRQLYISLFFLFKKYSIVTVSSILSNFWRIDKQRIESVTVSSMFGFVKKYSKELTNRGLEGNPWSMMRQAASMIWKLLLCLDCLFVLIVTSNEQWIWQKKKAETKKKKFE